MQELAAVMAGLVPAIHALLGGQDVDARHKAGHDVERLVHSTAKQT
jgi:hypothetical protein